jgi:hypothetical protein
MGMKTFDDSVSMPSLETASVSSINKDEDFDNLESITSLVAVSDSSIDEDEDWYIPVNVEHIHTSFAGAVVAGTEASRKAESDLYNSGASRHMTHFCHQLINYTKIESRPITAADKHVFHAIGKGDMHIQIPNGKTCTTVLLKDVLYAPDMGLTIISISCVAAARFAALFCANFCHIFDPKQRRIRHIHVTTNGLYCVDHNEVISAAGTSTTKLNLDELHWWMGHIAPEATRKLVKDGLVSGIELKGKGDAGLCDSCEYAKSTRKRIRKERIEPRAQNFGDEIHSNVWGPSQTETIRKRKYYMSFTNDSTCYTRVELLWSKDETFEAYQNFEAWVQTQHNAKIKWLHSDCGGKYTSNEFTAHLNSQGTECCLTTHDTPEHNGIAKALNGRLLECVCAMLHQSGLPKFIWGDTIQHPVWLKNRTSTRALDNMTPYEALTGNKPNLSHLHEWGSKVWVHDSTNGKLEGRSKVGRWVGFNNDSTHAHRIYWLVCHTVSIECNIKFDEHDIFIPIPATVDNTLFEGCTLQSPTCPCGLRADSTNPCGVHTESAWSAHGLLGPC